MDRDAETHAARSVLMGTHERKRTTERKSRTSYDKLQQERAQCSKNTEHMNP